MAKLSTRWVVGILLLVPGWALAGSVYLNGINIDGVTDQKFEKATVRIDERGNIFIDAPGYAAKVVQGPPVTRAPAPAPAPTPMPAIPPPAPVVAAPPPPPAPAPAPVPTRITKRYWLATSQTAPGMTEYDIDVYINAKWLMTLRNGSEQDVVDITRYLVPGKNTVTFEAKKLSSGERKSYSNEHVFSVVVGEGNEGGGNVMIDNPLASFKRTAADTDSISREFTFNTR